VVAESDHTFVFTVRDGHAERRSVQLGQRQAGSVEVLDGLRAGDPVVREGVQRLRGGTAVRVLNQGQDQELPGPEGPGA
jgi:membrane fusion protein (multidrug efflux system)